MIEVKRVEIRDRATLVPALALRVDGDDDPLLARAGFHGMPFVILIHFTHMECQFDPFGWTGRTMHEAHLWLEANWDNLKDGGVLDVEWILGETDKPKESEL